jgi:GT2 family glycosyltransferase
MNKVSVIIINYNTFALTSNCIRSLIEKTQGVSYEIILVDNASVECDANKFLDELPSVKLIKSEKNGGFAYGNNLGLEKATGDYILLLNSDTILLEDSISKSVEYLNARPDIGVLGCRMVFADGEVQISVRPFKTISWELLNFFKFIPLLMPYKKRARKMLGKYFRHDTDIECDWIGGAFFLMPKKIIEMLPGKKLDDRFFMYGEDQLWCEQIRKLGYIILFYAGTTIVHINSGSTDISKQLKIRKTIMKHELEIIRLRKGNGVYFFVYKLIFVSLETVRYFFKSIYFFFTGKIIRK